MKIIQYLLMAIGLYWLYENYIKDKIDLSRSGNGNGNQTDPDKKAAESGGEKGSTNNWEKIVGKIRRGEKITPEEWKQIPEAVRVTIRKTYGDLRDIIIMESPFGKDPEADNDPTTKF